MRLWLNLLLLACIAAGVAVIYADAHKPRGDVQTNTGVPLRVNMIDEEKLKPLMLPLLFGGLSRLGI